MIRGLVIALVVGIAVWLLALLILVIVGRKQQARELAAAIRNLLVLFRGLLRDPRVPRRSKIWLVVAVIWIASPIDLVPEFIPVDRGLDASGGQNPTFWGSVITMIVPIASMTAPRINRKT